LGARPGTRYVEAERQRPDLAPVVALDPGGHLANWRQLGWLDKGDGRSVPQVTTDPRDFDPMYFTQLVTLDAKAAAWSRPSPLEPIEQVVVDPDLIRFTGRDSPIIDAIADGQPDPTGRRVVYGDADQLAFAHKWAKALGKHRFAKRTGLPLKVAERAALGRPIRRANVTKALRALSIADGTEDLCACGCGRPVIRGRGARYVDDMHRQRARVERQRERRHNA
jgi:hypothetical protein